jgi:lactate permease
MSSRPGLNEGKEGNMTDPMWSGLGMAAPFVVLILLSTAGRVTLWKGALAAYGLAWGLAGLLLEWNQIPLQRSLGQGLLTALELMLILFGAIFFLHFLKGSGVIDAIGRAMDTVFPHRAERVLVLVWLLGGFIEGASGFGTPALIIAPMLVGFGLSVHLAVAVALLANTTAVTFGAVGTPIQVGFAGLETDRVPLMVAGINLVVASLVPVWIIRWVRTEAAPDEPRLSPWHGVGYALLFLVPYGVASAFGGSFPSLVGGAGGLVLLLIHRGLRSSGAPGRAGWQAMGRAFLPYLVLSGLLLLGKLTLGGFTVRASIPGGASRVYSAFQPGIMYFLAAGLVWGLAPARYQAAWRPAVLTALRSAYRPFVVILFLAALAHHTLQLERATGVLHALGDRLNGVGLVALTPWLGAFGSFVAGSATVSNLLFGSELASMARGMGVDVAWVLALQLAGAGVGNAMAFQNMVAVQAAIRSEGMEGPILKRLVLPCCLYLVGITLVGLLVQGWRGG